MFSCTVFYSVPKPHVVIMQAPLFRFLFTGIVDRTTGWITGTYLPSGSLQQIYRLGEIENPLRFGELPG